MWLLLVNPKSLISVFGLHLRLRVSFIVGGVGTVEKPELLLRRLFQALVEIIKNPIADRHSLSDFHQVRQFRHRAVP